MTFVKDAGPHADGAFASGAGTCAVIVTFHPDMERLRECVAALADSVATVVIVDNGSPNVDDDALRPLHGTVLIRRLGRNEGVSAAQNIGIALARERGHSHVLLLDQDSVPHASMVERLCHCLNHLRAQGNRVACVGPRIRLSDGTRSAGFTTFGWLGPRQVRCADGTTAVECHILMASGCLIPLDVLEKAGAMDETFFIDQVDTDWCLRVRARGYRVFGACDALLDHRLGERILRVWLGRWRRLPRHMPVRYYYIFRNTILLARRRYAPLKWVLGNLRWLVALLVFFGLPNPGRGGELRMMCKGIVDGLRGVGGKLREP